MHLKLKRVVRTSHSEEIAIFDSDTRDANDAAVSIGKLEVHYLSDQVVGTLLIWSEFADGYRATHGANAEQTMDDLIDAILTEVTEPLGVSTEYGIEVYYPSVTRQSFISNYADDGSDADEDEEDYADYDEEENVEGAQEAPGAGTGMDDDYYRKLTRREQ